MRNHQNLFLLLLITLIFASCSTKSELDDFALHPKGFYYRLFSFSNNLKRDNTNYIALISAIYKTQSDSAFWSSNHDFDNKFYLKINPTQSGNYIEQFLQGANAEDSVCLLINNKDFFKQQFYSKNVPVFSAKDSVVKVYLKVLGIFKENAVDSLEKIWEENEKNLVKNYLMKEAIPNAFNDSLNVCWLMGKPNYNNLNLLKNKTVSMSYKGYLLNGKQFDESPVNWQVNTATPDQMLKGINYAIKFLNKGENTKIILPSYLAFGKYGTGNIIPPYTPLLYEITINDIVN
ncbi:MAG: FKBP-type peptidyl-prolyl cis-trans isomerase [Bacteroidia bacterium]|nr:FKBP-type peptidyl-prolyl cis-trans isomerase [Bacteroidia bacterium]